MYVSLCISQTLTSITKSRWVLIFGFTPLLEEFKLRHTYSSGVAPGHWNTESWYWVPGHELVSDPKLCQISEFG